MRSIEFQLVRDKTTILEMQMQTKGLPTRVSLSKSLFLNVQLLPRVWNYIQYRKNTQNLNSKSWENWLNCLGEEMKKALMLVLETWKFSVVEGVLDIKGTWFGQPGIWSWQILNTQVMEGHRAEIRVGVGATWSCCAKCCFVSIFRLLYMEFICTL